MKDKLRELVDELMSACEMIGYATSGNEQANHRATRDKIKAEILAILDAEGDGEAVAAEFEKNPILKGMLTAYAKRIKADEGAVPAWVDALAEKWAYCLAADHFMGPALKQCAGELLDTAYGRKGPPYKFVYGIGRAIAHPPAQAAQVDRSVAIRLAQYGAEYAYRHKDWSIEPLQDGCEGHIDEWIAQAGCKCCNALTAEPASQGEAAQHWHDLYRKECQLRQDDATRYGHQILDLEAAQPRAVPNVLRETLENIVAADPRKWEELSEPEGEFERWAKARARHALAAAPSPGESE